MLKKDLINKVFLMDNLKLMGKIPNNSVDLIYCDILYGTGKDFGDYKDIKADKKIVKDFYLPRIKEMHRILKDTGSIYLQMDCRINHWVRLIMDHVFKYNNFRNEIIWNTGDCISGYKSLCKTKFVRQYDMILFYSKTKDIIFNKQKVKNKNNNQTHTCGDLWNDIYSFYFSCMKKKEESPEGYYSQKPKKLLERIIKASSNEGDVVADFFCGSGTTLVVAKELGRKYIGCDINKKAVEICKKRGLNISK